MNVRAFAAHLGRRVLLLGRYGSFDTLVAELQALPPHFVLFVAADTSGVDVGTLARLADRVIHLGASYVCCWGPDCERLHDIFDESWLTIQGAATDDRVLMTTWHAGDTLEDAASFALSDAHPSPDFLPTTNAVVFCALARPDYHAALFKYLEAREAARAEA